MPSLTAILITVFGVFVLAAKFAVGLRRHRIKTVVLLSFAAAACVVAPAGALPAGVPSRTLLPAQPHSVTP